jgi:hypothetical protein
MASSKPGQAKPGFTIKAFGFELRLWNEAGGVEWGASITCDGKEEFTSRFEEDNLTLAQLHLLAEARNRAMVRWRDKEFPPVESLIDSWDPVNMLEP